MSQEFDINEYWEQFDDKSRWIGFATDRTNAQTPTIVDVNESDEVIQSVAWILQEDEMKTEQTKSVAEDENIHYEINKMEDIAENVAVSLEGKTSVEDIDEEVVTNLYKIFQLMKETVK